MINQRITHSLIIDIIIFFILLFLSFISIFIFLKPDSSTTRYNTYMVALSFIRVVLNATSWALVCSSMSLGSWCPFSTTSHTSWEPRRAFICRLHLSWLTPFVNIGRGYCSRGWSFRSNSITLKHSFLSIDANLLTNKSFQIKHSLVL